MTRGGRLLEAGIMLVAIERAARAGGAVCNGGRSSSSIASRVTAAGWESARRSAAVGVRVVRVTSIMACNLLRWAPIELVVTLFATSESTSLLLKLVHADSRQRGSLVVLGGVVMNLMNWYSGVYYVWLNGLLLDNGLDSLVHMMVYVLASDCWLSSACALTINMGLRITIPRLFGIELTLHIIGVIVLVRTVLSGYKVVMMLLW